VTDTPLTRHASPRWLHYWAVLTACATLPLVLLGAQVTTIQVGMVDPAWPTPPWQLWLVSWRESGLGFLIEHSHRLAGYTVGFCSIVLAAGLWWYEPRRWLSWLGIAALAGVCVQGVLGGMRVRLNALMGTDLAMVHGIFGQCVLALFVSVALLTSRGWAQAAAIAASPGEAARLRRGSLALVGLVLVQLALGAVLRHKGSTLAQRGHLIVAFAVVAVGVWLAREVFAAHSRERQLTRSAVLVVGLLAVQLLLGVEAWMVKFSAADLTGAPSALSRADLIRSAHVLVGALVLASSVVLALEAHRRSALVVQPAAVETPQHLEGAA
jgi:cytochrome c oxidase assembly protein subunit 15